MKFEETVGLYLIIQDSGIISVFDTVPKVGELEGVPEGLDEAALRKYIQDEAKRLGFTATPDEFYDWAYLIEVIVVEEKPHFIKVLFRACRGFWLRASWLPWCRLMG